MTQFDLSGKVVVLTGASGGLGSALATELHQRGARLALLDLDLERVRAQASALGDTSVAAGWQADVRSLSELQSVLASIRAHFGRIDVVIANAGIDRVGTVDSMAPATYEQVIDINLNGVWRTFKAALPYVQEHRGYLAAISSMAAFFHSPLQSAYAASKAGVWALCNSLRLEVRHLGVDVGSFHPTFFPTPLLDDLVADPASHRLWNGNKRGIWKRVSKEMVVAKIVNGIQRRSQITTIPSSLSLVANAPGLTRQWIEKIGFNAKQIRDAVELSIHNGTKVNRPKPQEKQG